MDSEVILTFGNSATVDAFLTAAAGGGKDALNFRVIVAEAAPSCSGHVSAVAAAAAAAAAVPTFPASTEGGSEHFFSPHRKCESTSDIRSRFELASDQPPNLAAKSKIARGGKGLKFPAAKFETMTARAAVHPRRRTIAPDNLLVEAYA